MKESILDELDRIIEKLDKNEGSIEEIAKIITDCVFHFNKEIFDLKHELVEANLEIDELEEENEMLQTDIEMILAFLKKNHIDISYIVRKTPVDESQD